MSRTRSLILLASTAGRAACLMPSTALGVPFSPPAWFSESVAQIKQHNPAANCEATLQVPEQPDTWQFPSSYHTQAGPSGCAFGNAEYGSPGSPTGSCLAVHAYSSTPLFSCTLSVSLLPYPAICSRSTDTNGDTWLRFVLNEIIAEREYAVLADCLESLDGVFQIASYPPKLSSGGPMTISFSKPGKLVVTDSSDSQCRAGHCSGKSKKNKNKYIPRMQTIKLTVAAAGVQTVQIKQSKSGRKIYNKLGKLQLAIDLKFTPAGGGPVHKQRKLIVLRRSR